MVGVSKPSSVRMHTSGTGPKLWFAHLFVPHLLLPWHLRQLQCQTARHNTNTTCSHRRTRPNKTQPPMTSNRIEHTGRQWQQRHVTHSRPDEVRCYSAKDMLRQPGQLKHSLQVGVE